MTKQHNVILLVTDGYGHYSGNLDWGTIEGYRLKERFESLDLVAKGYIKCSNVVSPAVSTIMSIESILSGIHAAKTHKMHWREWPSWDRFDHPLLSDFLMTRGYQVHGFSYLLNSENWLPGIHCYRPDIYKDFPSHKRDTHSHEAVLAAVRHFFENEFTAAAPNFLIIHSVHLYDMWSELQDLFHANGITAENTITAFTADHYFPKNFGRQWLLGERDGTSVFHHTDLTESNTRVFLYLKYPGSEGREFPELVAGYDIAPTILDLLGLSQAWHADFDGTSLLPLFNGGQLPERVIRTDNLYPYQIGEKQGRITALRKGRFKFVSRPDPVSSYISYRMDEPWSVALGHEELYDIDSDAEERNNLIASDDAAVRSIVGEFRELLARSNVAVMCHHAGTLVAVFHEKGLGSRIFGGAQTGRLLCIESSPEPVFATLVNLFRRVLPGWSIDLVVKRSGSLTLSGFDRIIVYPGEGVYARELLQAVITADNPLDYDCIVNTSNVPLGDFLKVYDKRRHPVGDFTVSAAVMNDLPARQKYSVCLDLSYAPAVGHRAAESGFLVFLADLKAHIGSLALQTAHKCYPVFKRIFNKDGNGSSMGRDFSERIIDRIE